MEKGPMLIHFHRHTLVPGPTQSGKVRARPPPFARRTCPSELAARHHKVTGSLCLTRSKDSSRQGGDVALHGHTPPSLALIVPIPVWLPGTGAGKSSRHPPKS